MRRRHGHRGVLFGGLQHFIELSLSHGVFSLISTFVRSQEPLRLLVMTSRHSPVLEPFTFNLDDLAERMHQKKRFEISVHLVPDYPVVLHRISLCKYGNAISCQREPSYGEIDTVR